MVLTLNSQYYMQSSQPVTDWKNFSCYFLNSQNNLKWPKRRIFFSLFICAWRFVFYIFPIILCAQMWLNPRTYMQIHIPTLRQGRVDETPPRSFWYVAVFRNDFTLGGKHLIFSTRWGIFYGWWRCWRPVTSQTMVAILAAIFDFTKN